MDADRFDTVTRFLTRARSRRGALLSLFGGALGVLGLTEADGRKKGKGKKKKKKKNPIPPSSPLPPPQLPQPFCAGKNTCGATSPLQCDVEGRPLVQACFCYVGAPSGQPVCGLLAQITDQTYDCELCAEGKICIHAEGCGLTLEFLCVTPCPDPL